MYLVIEQDYSISFSKIETGHLHGRARSGEISLINVGPQKNRVIQGLNYSQQTEFPEMWSDIPEYEPPSEQAA